MEHALCEAFSHCIITRIMPVLCVVCAMDAVYRSSNFNYFDSAIPSDPFLILMSSLDEIGMKMIQSEQRILDDFGRLNSAE